MEYYSNKGISTEELLIAKNLIVELIQRLCKGVKMSAVEPLCRLLGINPGKLSKEEYLFLETELFYRILEELRENFRMQHKTYFQLMKYTKEMENNMLEENFIRSMIKDILLTKEYTVEGIANYTDSHTDVVYEVVFGKNSNPSASFLRKTIELHRSVRSELYNTFIKKITSEYLAA